MNGALQCPPRRRLRRAALALALVLLPACGPALYGGAAVTLQMKRTKATPADASVTIDEEYVGPLGVLAFLVKTVWFYLFTRPQPGRLRLSLDALRAARRGDFTGHERFLV